MYFEIYRQGGEWRWRLNCPDQEPITGAESYADHADCLRAVYLLRGTSSHTPIRDV